MEIPAKSGAHCQSGRPCARLHDAYGVIGRRKRRRKNASLSSSLAASAIAVSSAAGLPAIHACSIPRVPHRMQTPPLAGQLSYLR